MLAAALYNSDSFKKQIDAAIESFMHTKNDLTVAAALESMARDNGEFRHSVTHELTTVVAEGCH